jgi:hypothetical protein
MRGVTALSTPPGGWAHGVKAPDSNPPFRRLAAQPVGVVLVKVEIEIVDVVLVASADNVAWRLELCGDELEGEGPGIEDCREGAEILEESEVRLPLDNARLDAEAAKSY